MSVTLKKRPLPTMVVSGATAAAGMRLSLTGSEVVEVHHFLDRCGSTQARLVLADGSSRFFEAEQPLYLSEPFQL